MFMHRVVLQSCLPAFLESAFLAEAKNAVLHLQLLSQRSSLSIFAHCNAFSAEDSWYRSTPDGRKAKVTEVAK